MAETPLFEDYPGRRPCDLAKMDGLPFKAADRYPHAVEMKRWGDAGLYECDLDCSCFRLTSAGRAAVGGAHG